MESTGGFECPQCKRRDIKKAVLSLVAEDAHGNEALRPQSYLWFCECGHTWPRQRFD
jgi:hypothetical protein